MAKNILMTTLSTLRDKNSLNYYYYGNSSRLIFCNGISSLEAGSKYILSTQTIDQIVVIGSKETFNSTDTLIVDDILQLQPQDIDTIVSMSHYEFYKMRIASFLQNTFYSDELAAISSLPKTETSITIDRKEAIKDLVMESIKAVVPNNCNTDITTYINQLLNTSENPNNVLSDIEKVMKQKLTLDINRSFESSNAYERYITIKQELAQKYTEIPWNDQNPLTILREQREKIDKDTSLSTLERQYLLISLKEKVNRIISERTMLSYQETINDLYLEIDRLNYKLNLIKSHRQKVETQYAKYVIFSLFDENHHLVPKQENTTHAIPMHFIKETDEESRDNLLEIVNSLYDNSGEPIHLYIDMQGGDRTSGYVRNAVLSILTNQTTNPVSIEKIVATKFTPSIWFNEIVEETSRYKIIDLASGMNAFIRYGKADIIQSYCEAVGIPNHSPFRKLVNCMIQIDDAISLCDMAELTQSIKNLQLFFSSQENMTYNDEFSNIYQVLLDGIRLDYGKLLDNSEELNLIELIKWSLRKGFIQQALTLIEDKMPSFYFKKNWISHELSPEHTTDFLNVLEPSYEHRIENKLFYSFTNKVESEEKSDIRNKFNELWWYYKTNGKNKYEPIESITDFENNLLEGNYSYILNSNLKEVVEETFHKLCSLPQEQLSKKLPFLYCKFRTMEFYVENHKNPSTKKTSELLYSYSPELFYYIMEQNDQFKYKKPSISFTMLSCLGKHTYTFKYKKKKTTFDVDLELKLHPALEKRQEKIEELFLLHHALKKERNCNNHASEKGLRLPKKIVANAIQIYLDKIQEIETFLTDKN